MAFGEEARICLISVLLGLSVLILPDIGTFDINFVSYFIFYAKYAFAIVIINGITSYVYKDCAYQVNQ